jgi:hypothetical protein
MSDFAQLSRVPRTGLSHRHLGRKRWALAGESALREQPR